MPAELVFVTNSRGQSVDTLYGADGVARIKLGIGAKDVSGQGTDGSWQGVASHADGATFGTNDGVIVAAGLDGTTVRKLTVDSSGRLLAVQVPTQGNLTDRSGTITSGGAAQTLAAVNVARKYLVVQNLDDTEDLWINFTTDAAVDTEGSILLKGGEVFKMEGSFVSTQLVSVIATTTGHKFTAKEG